MRSANRPLPKGIYTPLPTFFQPNEDLDLAAYATHVHHIAAAGTIPVVAGSAGEAPHLTREERSQLIKTAREALDTNDLGSVPIVAGVGAPSTRETIQLARDAEAAGADYAMVLPPGYYAGQLSGESGRPALLRFFVDVAEASSLPVILYNFPAVSGGIDLDDGLIVDVMKASANVVGVKLTCASVGKITRINAVISSPEFRQKYPRQGNVEFRIIDGFIDILLPSIASGAAGAISGLPNIVPKTCVKLWELSHSLPGTKDYEEAQRLQNVLALADGACQKIGIAGLKMLVHLVLGHSEIPRLPLLPMGKARGAEIVSGQALQNVLEEEKLAN